VKKLSRLMNQREDNMGMLRFGFGLSSGVSVFLSATVLLLLNGRVIAQTPPAPAVPVAPAAPTVPAPTVPVAPTPAVESPFDLPKSIPTVSPGAIPVATPTPQASPTVPVEDPIRLVVQRGKRQVMVYRGKTVVAKYPIAVGKKGWETPIGDFKVLTKEENPIFKSFKTGVVIEPGPDNPLGVRWIGIWTDGKTQLGFHGTDQPELIGKAVSHGCIRMHNKDVTALYAYVQMGTAVTVEK
jgi:lipoprotein-anchoring transpeptidase ErfK/SrfK